MSSSQLTARERQVLGALIMRKDARPGERTVKAVANLTALSEDDVQRTLEQLDSLAPKLVHRDWDTKLNIEFWIALEAAIEALESPQTQSVRITGLVRDGVQVDLVADVRADLKLGDSFHIGRDCVQITAISAAITPTDIAAEWTVQPYSG